MSKERDFEALATQVEDFLDSLRLNKTPPSQPAFSDALHATYNLLASKKSNHYNTCLAMICHAADNSSKLDEYNKTLLQDCISKSRVFLYNDMLASNNEAVELGLTDAFAKDFYTLEETNTTLTRDQKVVFDEFIKRGKVVVSAPTSFGKTRLLEEILIAKQYRVSVIVFPTLALLAEQYKRLKSRPELNQYHISTSSKIAINPETKYILMLTPERLSLFMSIPENSNVTFDFFCVDEIYKADASQQGNRKYFFADTIYKLAKYSPRADFYLIGPYLNSFSENFLIKFKAKFLRFNSEVVQKEYYDLDAIKKSGDFPGVVKSASKKVRVIKTLESLKKMSDSKSLVFCKDKHTTQLVAEYASLGKQTKKENEELAQYIASSISNDWSLVKFIRSGIAYHNGNIPRHIQELIVDAFDDKGASIDVLACTTTLIEGVNTNAKNIIFFDGKVADTDIDPFTQKNIEGRAGRLTRHFLGKIYYLDSSLDATDTLSGNLDVELEVFGQDKPTPEAAIQVDPSDLPPKGENVYDDTFSKAAKNHIPLELLKSNKFINVDKQIELVNYLRERASELGALNLNDYMTLKWVLTLSHNYLFNEKDRKNEVSLEKYYIPKSLSYIMHPVSLKRLIDEDIQWRKVNRPDDSVDKVISNTIKFYSDYIEYAWPRYLSAFEKIYNFVQFENNKPSTDFDVLIAKLEYGSTEKHHILLREAGVPFEIIQKIGSIFEKCTTPEEIYSKCDESTGQIKKLLGQIEYRVLRFYI